MGDVIAPVIIHRVEFAQTGHGFTEMSICFSGHASEYKDPDWPFTLSPTTGLVHPLMRFDKRVIRIEFSNTLTDFFHQLLGLKEGMFLGVQVAFFHFDAEGPEGRILWVRGDRSSNDMIRIDYDGGRGYPKLEIVFPVEPRDFAKNVYAAFRSWVDSGSYNPFFSDDVTLERAFQILLPNDSVDEIVERLVRVDRKHVVGFLECLSRRARPDALSSRYLIGALPDVLAEAMIIDLGDDAAEDFRYVLPLDWDQLSVEERRMRLAESLTDQLFWNHSESILNLVSPWIENEIGEHE